MSDGLKNKFNSYAYELYLKHIGVLSVKTSKKVNLYTDTSYDSSIILMLIENLNESEKKITLEINSSGYYMHDIEGDFKSLDNYQYNTTIKSKEMIYFVPIALDHKIKQQPEHINTIDIKYNLIID